MITTSGGLGGSCDDELDVSLGESGLGTLIAVPHFRHFTRFPACSSSIRCGCLHSGHSNRIMNKSPQYRRSTLLLWQVNHCFKHRDPLVASVDRRHFFSGKITNPFAPTSSRNNPPPPASAPSPPVTNNWSMFGPLKATLLVVTLPPG